jgi:predicted nucleotidyltransferase
MLIRDKDKNILIDIAIKTIKEPSKILAYGSRVNGNAHDTSDLDLVIVSKNKEKLDINDFMKFKDELKKSNIPILIQVLDWYRLPEAFHKNIMTNYEEIVNIRG